MKHANVALFVPHNGCPHQCSFCNQRSITGRQNQPTAQDVIEAVQTAQKSLKDTQNVEIAFFGGSFTAIERGYMISLLEAAAPYVGRNGGFAGIRISTRPDAIDEETLSLLKRYGVSSIELGAQSMDDRVLSCNRRGHTSAQVEKASAQIRAYGFSLGLQMMTGLYGDTPAGAMDTARRLAALKPDTIRIYPTIVMRGTELEALYQRGAYLPMELEEAVSLCAELLDFFEGEQIRVIRLGLHSTPELGRDRLAGPWHPAFRELCESQRFYNKVYKYLQDNIDLESTIEIKVNPKDISKALGQKKKNVAMLMQMGYSVRFVQDAQVSLGQFLINAL
ncbi:radical SAM protein [Clostridium sp. D33t1_170424_F3]|uniref:elongator complex protein 3 n=1 Tax=Clostridium sp. D33t1_170424_F3 TaxID=2787099 RepID=UPI0018AAFD3A|nr:radical SAM protein [Clostridium sp. D33t1_170424_F3]